MARSIFSISSILALLSIANVTPNLLADAPVAAESPKLKFNQDVRPILSSACYRCHGFDAKTREADLRLDTFEAATAMRDSGKPAIAPGKLDSSMIWERILSTDPDAVMPPPSSNHQLSPAEKQTIATWIEQGANYEKHWSFESISAANANAESSIDKLLHGAHKSKGLDPLGLADPVTQVRRLSFTLTGLPPTLTDVELFAAEPTDANYSKLVDQYLAAPQYGEEMAKHWLDVARYGDTHGLHLDNERQAWAYRDWVVDAFNANLPFSQFTIEQLAGDLLPNPSPSQLAATGFNRCNVTTSEGGAINEEFLYRYAVDRTSTTIQTWLGLTGGCAVCHDHKYDPISTREFYSMYSFFYSAADPAMDGNIDNTAPFLKLASESKMKLDELTNRTSQLAESLKQIGSSKESVAYEQKDAPKLATPQPMTSVWLDDDFNYGASLRNTSRNSANWSGDVGSPMGIRSLKQDFGDRFEQVITGGLRPLWIPEQGSLQVWLMTDRFEPPKSAFIEIRTQSTTKQFVWCNEPQHASQVGFDPSRIQGPLPQPGRWTMMTIPLKELPVGDKVAEVKLGLFGGVCHWDGLVCTGIQRPSELFNSDLKSWWGSVQGSDVPLATGEVAKAIKEGPESELGKAKLAEVATFFRTYISESASPQILRARREWQTAQVELAKLDASIPGSLIYNDLPMAREAFVMTRGQYDQKGEKVVPDTLAVLPRLTKPAERELDLANWLVSDENPLTARVTVNRFWQQVFGVGLVKTSDDFGSQGSPPIHPELLDSLASRFRSQGWNVKQLMRELVSSTAFRRSAVVSPQAWNVDPENRLLARGPRMRLDAEQIRDNVLAVSGLLRRTLGGPGIKGYQPPNIWEPVGYGDSNTRYYIQDHGDVLYRRSLYSFIKRTAPPPFMSNFDAPNRELFCTRRERSNTPLQALQLMNDVQHVEAARALAESILTDANVVEADRVEQIFVRVLSRKPIESERTTLKQALTKFQLRFQENPQDATRLISVGEKASDPGLSSLDVASYTLVANLVLNLDETVNRN
jgi:hypothetical protein